MRQTLELALEALERSVATCFDQRSHDEVMGRPEHFVNRAITAIKEALAQPEQEPVAWLCKRKDGHFDVLSDQTCTKCFPVYTHPESEQNDKFCDANCVWTDHHPDCKLVQPEQELMAHTLNCVCGAVWDIKADGSEEMVHTPNTTPPQGIYYTPQQRTWVGLTNEDKQTAFDATQEGGGFWEFADAIEAKLKEKNHG